MRAVRYNNQFSCALCRDTQQLTRTASSVTSAWFKRPVDCEYLQETQISRPEARPVCYHLDVIVPVCSSWVSSASLGWGGQVWHTPVATGLDASSLGGDGRRLAGWPLLVLSSLLFSAWRPRRGFISVGEKMEAGFPSLESLPCVFVQRRRR